MGMDIPMQAIRRQLASGIDLMIHLGRLRDKRRVLLEISEVVGCENGEILLNPIFQFKKDVINQWEKVGELQNKDKLLAAGFSDD